MAKRPVIPYASPQPVYQQQPQAARGWLGGRIPICQACGGRMKKAVQSSGNAAGLAVALIVFVAGIVVFVLIPLIGWVIGPLICLFALFMGGKRQKVWRCRSCRAVIPRG